MTYQEMLDRLTAMEEAERRETIRRYWQGLFSEEFVSFVQGQMEASRKMVLAEGEFAELFETLDETIVRVLRQQALVQMGRLGTVWDSLETVYAEMQQEIKQAAQQHPPHAARQSQLQAQTSGATCYRCGSPASAGGLCSGCLDQQQDWEQDDLDYDLRLHEQQRNDLDYQRLENDRLYYDTLQDFNSYTDTYSDY